MYSQTQTAHNLPRRPGPPQILPQPRGKDLVRLGFPCLRAPALPPGRAGSTHGPVATGLRRVPSTFAPNSGVVPAEINTDLPIRLASQDAYSDVRPIRKRQPLLPASNSTAPPTCCFEGTTPTAPCRVKLVIRQNHCGCILVVHGCYMAGNQQSRRMVDRPTGRFVAVVHDKQSEIPELEIK